MAPQLEASLGAENMALELEAAVKLEVAVSEGEAWAAQDTAQEWGKAAPGGSALAEVVGMAL